MPLKTPLLFHFNQHLNEYAYLASKVCYIGLLETLLESEINVNIHISGTLIQALKWLDPEPIRLIQLGVEHGKFEIVGSTHAQNVPYATDDRDNREQIRLHRAILKDTFGVQPEAFWISERCWRQSLLPVIASEGYKVITLEDHILNAAGAASGALVSTAFEGYRLKIVRDDEVFKHWFNFSAWFGDSVPLIQYLEEFNRENPGVNRYLAYAEDAEAMGLWGYEQGIIPDLTWERLKATLSEIHRHTDIEPVMFGDLPQPSQEIPFVPDGSAAWMDASLNLPDRPYHEGGFKNWFDFVENSDKLVFFRKYYDRIRQELDAFEGENTGAKLLLKLARQTYLTHQYEFGCIGIGGETSRSWRGAAAAIPILILADQRKYPVDESIFVESETFRLLRGEFESAIVCPIGGRVLFWADVDSGKLMIGNYSSVVAGNFEGLAVPPEPILYSQKWLPSGEHFAEFMISEEPPTRMQRFLPDWIWEKKTSSVSLAVRQMRLEGTVRQSRPAQQGAFYDEIVAGKETVFGKRTPMTWTGDRYHAALNESLVLEKQCQVRFGRLEMHYYLLTDKPVALCLRVFAEIAGDYAALQQDGRNAIELHGPGVKTSSGEVIQMVSSIPPKKTFQEEGLLSLIIGIEINLELIAGDPAEFTISLVRLN